MKRLGLVVILLVLVIGLLLPLNTTASFLYQYYNTGADGVNEILLAYGDWVGQTFTTGGAYNITSVKLLVYRRGLPGNVTVGIRATNATTGLPTGNDLCNTTINGNNLTATPGDEWREITLGTGYNLSATTKYAIVVRVPGGSPRNTIGWRYDGSSPTYSGGSEVYSLNSGSTWASTPSRDCMFETWGEAISQPTITTNNATYVSRTTARLNAYLCDDGGEPCDVRFQYDVVSSEDQTNYDSTNKIYTGLMTRAGQTLNITNRTVTGLSFPLRKRGAPTGDVNFTIRYTGNDTLINSVTWGDASSLASSAQWETASFAVPVVVNASVHILVEFYSGDAVNHTEYHHEDSNEKNNEFFTHYNGTYIKKTAYDGAYKYYYGGGSYGNGTPWVNDTYVTGNSPYLDISSLDVNTTYCFRAQARNSLGTTNGSELNFTTDPNIFEPTSLTAYPNSTSISLTWIKGVNAAYTMVRGQTGAYPANYTNGEQVYAGFMSTALHSGLTPGTTYYYRAYSYDGAGYCTTYAQTLMTTLASGEDVTEIPAAPGSPSNWWEMPDYTRLSNLAGYGFINDIADQYSIPHNTFWMSLILIGIMCSGLFIYSVQHNATVAIVIIAVLIVVASIAKLLPLLLIAFIALPAGAIMMVKRRI